MRYMERSTFYCPMYSSDNQLRLHLAKKQFTREMSAEAPKQYTWGIAPRLSTNHHFEKDMCYIEASIIEELINPVVEKGTE